MFHCSLDDDNYTPVMPSQEKLDRYEWARATVATYTDEERELIRMHDLMSKSQRRRLGAKSSAIVLAEWRNRYNRPQPVAREIER